MTPMGHDGELVAVLLPHKPKIEKGGTVDRSNVFASAQFRKDVALGWYRVGIRRGNFIEATNVHNCSPFGAVRCVFPDNKNWVEEREEASCWRMALRMTVEATLKASTDD